MPPSEPTRLLLLGYDHGRHGAIELLEPAAGLACGITAGSDPDSPSMASKGDLEHPNEDGLLVIDDGRHALLAVADGHHGVESSHALLGWLNDLVGEPPTDGRSMLGLLQRLESMEPAPPGPAGSTLLIAWLDRQTGVGIGVSFGDSSVALVGETHEARPLNQHNRRYVSPAAPQTLALGGAEPFQFQADPGDLLLVFTDGIDGCHYGSPETSLQASHLTSIARAHDLHPGRTAAGILEQALRGVDGNPGGQDNIALIATVARSRG